jgi:hypothetical protein
LSSTPPVFCDLRAPSSQLQLPASSQLPSQWQWQTRGPSGKPRCMGPHGAACRMGPHGWGCLHGAAWGPTHRAAWGLAWEEMFLD